MTVYKWDRTTPANNATADATINWQEGQASSTVNDSARAMMTAVAKYRDDIAGRTTTGSGPSNYTLASNQGFTSLALMDGAMVAFVMNVTSSTPVQLNVDGLGLKPLRATPGVELSAGQLVAGTPYAATYFNATNQWILQGVPDLSGVTTAVVPIGGIIQYGGITAPASNFALCNGALISTTTYATLFALMGYAYGGAGATFGVPDLRGRVAAGMDNMGALGAQSRLTSATMTPDGNTRGAVGGVEQRFQLVGEIAAHIHHTSLSDPGHAHSIVMSSGFNIGGTPSTAFTATGSTNTSSNTSGITIGTGGSGNSDPNVQNAQMPNVQPTLIVNSIIRIL